MANLNTIELKNGQGLQLQGKNNNNIMGNSYLGKDAFLKILITQLQNQDPTSPMEDKDFIAQLAQFSSLEQMQQLNGMFAQFMGMQMEDSFFGYAELIGKKVEYETKVESDGEEEKAETVKKEGIVKSVTFKDGQIMVEMEDGSIIPSISITKITSNNEK